MKTSIILQASNVHELRSSGSYYDVKNSIEKELDNKLGVNGWDSFFEKIQALKETVPLNKDYLLSVCKKNSFKESKKEISKLLGINIKARDWLELKNKIKLIINVFCSSAFDPYVYYEKTKLEKFKNSSKLEGIDIEIPSETTSLESVLAKYRR